MIHESAKIPLRTIHDSLKRLSYKYDCPVERLKDAFFASLSNSVAWDVQALELLKEKFIYVEAPTEAREFAIQPNWTGAYFIAQWIEERIEALVFNEARKDALEGKIKELTGKTSDEILENYNEAHVPLAPDLSKANNLENKILRIAQQLSDYLEYHFKPLTEKGRCEALMYNCILLVRFRPEFGNDIYLSNLCDRVFLLLSDIIPSKGDIDLNVFFDLFNQRNRAWSNPDYPVTALYYSFYSDPLADIAVCPANDVIDDEDLHQFDLALSAMKIQIIGKYGDFRNDPDLSQIDKPEYLKQFGLSNLAVNNLIGMTEPEPKELVVGQDFSIHVNYEGFKCKVELAPIEKALYILYLKHPEGINFKDLTDYQYELIAFYQKISRRNDEDALEKTILRLIDPFNNSINEKCARIKRAFEESVPAELVHWYTINGEKGGIRRIELPREKTNLQF